MPFVSRPLLQLTAAVVPGALMCVSLLRRCGLRTLCLVGCPSLASELLSTISFVRHRLGHDAPFRTQRSPVLVLRKWM